MAVRRHINALERDGLITASLLRKGMGRPSYVYSLTPDADEMFPKSYHKLILDLLDEMNQDDQDASLIEELFARRQARLEKAHSPRMKGKTFYEQLQELTDIQNEGGYMAELEQQGEDAFVLHEYNCPITQVANRYEQACQCELNLFKSLLNTDHIQRTECLAKGGSRCSYLIYRKNETKKPIS